MNVKVFDFLKIDVQKMKKMNTNVKVIDLLKIGVQMFKTSRPDVNRVKISI